MRKSHIEIRKEDGKGESLVAANYLPAVAAVSRQLLDEDPDARWVAQFHPLMARSLDQLTYRQFNYVTMMGLPTQLARWLYRQLCIKFTFASLLGKPFEMRYSVFIKKLKDAKIDLNRKMLSELAIHDPAAFKTIVDTVNSFKK